MARLSTKKQRKAPQSSKLWHVKPLNAPYPGLYILADSVEVAARKAVSFLRKLRNIERYTTKPEIDTVEFKGTIDVF